jgi:hypothetical protein
MAAHFNIKNTGENRERDKGCAKGCNNIRKQKEG